MSSPQVSATSKENSTFMSLSSTTIENQLTAVENEAINEGSKLPTQKQDPYKTHVRQGVNRIRMQIADMRLKGKTEYEISKALPSLIQDFRISNQAFITKNMQWNEQKQEVQKDFQNNAKCLTSLKPSISKLSRENSDVKEFLSDFYGAKPVSKPDGEKIFHFPDKAKLTQCLKNSPTLNSNYYQEKGITKAVSELAGKRLGGEERYEMGITNETTHLVEDLKNGKDGITRKPLSNVSNVGKSLTSPITRIQLSLDTEHAIKGCAINETQDNNAYNMSENLYRK